MKTFIEQNSYHRYLNQFVVYFNDDVCISIVAFAHSMSEALEEEKKFLEKLNNS